MADELHRLILQTVGQQELEGLQASLERAKKSLDDEVAAALKHGAAHAQASSAVKDAAADVLRYEQAIREAVQSQAQAGVATQGLNYSISTLAYSLDDVQQFQFGFAQGWRSISNNVPGLIGAFSELQQVGIGGLMTALAGPAGLTIALTGLGIAATAVINHWDQFQEALGLGIPAPALEGPAKLTAELKKTSAELDNLREKTRLTLAESLRLQELERTVPQLQQQQRDIRETESLLETPSKAARDIGGGVKEAIGTVGGPAALDQLTAALERTADAQGRVANPYGGQGTAEEVARTLLLEASRGDLFARGQITQAVGAESTFGQALQAQSPEGKAAAKERDDRQKEIDALNRQGVENEIAGQEQARRQDEEERRRQARLTEELNRTGQENEEAGRREALQSSKQYGDDLIARAAAGQGLGVNEIVATLRTRGVDEQTARTLAGEGMAAAERQRVGADLREPNRQSQILDDVASAIQRGVGGDQDIPRQQLDIQKKQLTALETLAKGGQVDWAGRPVVSRKYF